MADNILYPIVVAEKTYNNIYSSDILDKRLKLKDLSTREFPYWAFYLRPIDWEDYKVPSFTITSSGKYLFIEWDKPIGNYLTAWVGCIINGQYRFSKLTKNNYILLDNYAFMPNDRIDIIIGFWIEQNENYDITTWNYDTTNYAYFDRDRPQALPLYYDSYPPEFYDYKCNFYDIGKIPYYCGDYNIPSPPPTLAFHTQNVYSGIIYVDIVDKNKYITYKNRDLSIRNWEITEFSINEYVADKNTVLKICESLIIKDKLYFHWSDIDKIEIDDSEYDVIGYKVYVNTINGSPNGELVYNVGKSNILKLRDLSDYEFDLITHIGILYKDDNDNIIEINNQYNICEISVRIQNLDICEKHIEFIPSYLRDEDNLVKEYLCAITNVKEVVEAQYIENDYETMAIKDLPSTIETRLIYPIKNTFLMKSVFKFRGTYADLKYIQKLLNVPLDVEESDENNDLNDCEIGTYMVIDLDDPDSPQYPSLSDLRASRKLLDYRLHACVSYRPLSVKLLMSDELEATGSDEIDFMNMLAIEDKFNFEGIEEEILFNKNLQIADALTYSGYESFYLKESLLLSDDLTYSGDDEIKITQVLTLNDDLTYQGSDEINSLVAHNEVPFTYDLPTNRNYTFDAPSGAGYVRDNMQNVDVEANWDDEFLIYDVVYV